MYVSLIVCMYEHFSFYICVTPIVKEKKKSKNQNQWRIKSTLSLVIYL